MTSATSFHAVFAAKSGPQRAGLINKAQTLKSGERELPGRIFLCPVE
jgi:hypothetical protein